MSETESQTMDSEDAAWTTSTSGSECPITTDNETETEEKEKDHFNVLKISSISLGQKLPNFT